MINGGPGDDILNGGDGDDDLNGGPGDDTFDGDADHDRMRGGPGLDTVNDTEGTNRCVQIENLIACRRSTQVNSRDAREGGGSGRPPLLILVFGPQTETATRLRVSSGASTAAIRLFHDDSRVNRSRYAARLRFPGVRSSTSGTPS